MPMANSRKIKLVVTAVLGLLPLLYFYEAVIGRVALMQGDGWTGNLGLRVLTAKLLTQATLPLWNPYIFGGMPLLADLSAGVLYPANWLFVWLPTGLALNLAVITTFHLALIGTYLYVRCLGCGRLSALVSGSCFAFGGYMVMSLGQSQNIAAAAWLPWVLLAVEKLYLQLSWHWLALGASFVTLQFFAGMPQLSFYTLLTAGAYFLFCLFARKPVAPRWQFVLSVGLLALCALLMTAIQLLPARELQQASGRAALGYEAFAEFSFPLKQIGALVIPFLYGGATIPPYHQPYSGEAGIFVTCGYVGLLALMLAFVAVSDARREKLVWFWSAAALTALLLALGSYLPFHLNELLFKLPVYGLFRAAYRHLFEFTFALAVLAGLGMDWLMRQDALQRRAAWLKSCAFTGLLVAIAVGANKPAWVSPEVLLPCGCLLASGGALGLLVWRPHWLSQSLLLAVLGADLLAYGHALEWRAYSAQMLVGLGDPPAVQFIKQREPDWNAFRILSYSTQPFGSSYSALNYPNNSIVRELQSVNGYDMLRLVRPAEMLGAMTPEGVVADLRAFDLIHQGFNLFNVKYLICERGTPLAKGPLTGADDLIFDGLRFPAAPLDLHLSNGLPRVLLAGGAQADELVLVTVLSNAGQLRDNAQVARIKLRMQDGRRLEVELLAGRDTAEWAYDRADVKASIQHRRAPVIESWPDEGFAGHRYLTRLPFARGAVESLEIEYAQQTAQLVIYRAVLRDASSGNTYATEPERWPSLRWKKLAGFGAVEVYVNLAWLPRSWVVNAAVALPPAEMLQTITQGQFPNQQPFDSTQVALVETGERASAPLMSETPLSRPESRPQARALRVAPGEAEYAINVQRPGMLVLSEVFYPGWEAALDGKPVPLLRVNYALRGVPLPAGEHRVHLRFQPSSVRLGAVISALGVLLLLASFIPIRYVQRWGS